MSYEKNDKELPDENREKMKKAMELAKEEIKAMQASIFFGAPTYIDKKGNVVDLSDQDVVDLKDLNDEHKER